MAVVSILCGGVLGFWACVASVVIWDVSAMQAAVIYFGSGMLFSLGLLARSLLSKPVQDPVRAVA